MYQFDDRQLLNMDFDPNADDADPRHWPMTRQRAAARQNHTFCWLPWWNAAKGLNQRWPWLVPAALPQAYRQPTIINRKSSRTTEQAESVCSFLL